jgi:heptosyltransferase II
MTAFLRWRHRTARAHARILLLAMLPIGDSLFVIPTVRALRARYPQAAIVALARASNAPILRCVPAIDEVLVLPTLSWWSGVWRVSRLLGTLARCDFDVAVDFTSPAYKWISLLAGIPMRTYMKFDRAWWLLPVRHSWWRSTHATRLYYSCASELDLPDWEHVDHTPRLALPAAARTAAAAWLARHHLDTPRTLLVCMHPGGAGLAGRKRWPVAQFAAVADRLIERHHARIILLGGPDERTLARAVAARMRHRAVLAAGELQLVESLGVVERCTLMVGNDSSLLHVAAAVGTAYVGIFGLTSLANFQPIPTRAGQGSIVAPWPPDRHQSYFVGGRPIWQRWGGRKAARRLASITPDQVLRCAEELLGPPA